MGGVKRIFLATRTKKSPNMQVFEWDVLTQITSQNFNLISRICHLAEGDTHHGLAIWTEVFLSFLSFFFFRFFFFPQGPNFLNHDFY